MKAEISSLNKKELIAKAKSLGLKNYSRLNKKELVSLILSKIDDKLKPKSVTTWQKVKLFVENNWYLILGISTILVIISNSIKIGDSVIDFFGSNDTKNIEFKTDLFKVLLLPFKPDKDCNIEDTYYEERLLNRYEFLSKEEQLDIEIIFDDSFECPLSSSEAEKIGKHKNADIVIYGNYLEECQGESQINIKYFLLKDIRDLKLPSYWESSPSVLTNLYDLDDGFLQENIDYILYYSAALRNYMIGKNYRSLHYLSKIYKVDSCDSSAGNLVYNNLMSIEQFKAASAINDSLVRCDGELDKYLYQKGMLNAFTGKIDDARKIFSKIILKNPYNFGSRIELIYTEFTEFKINPFVVSDFSVPVMTDYRVPENININQIISINGTVHILPRPYKIQKNRMDEIYKKANRVSEDLLNIITSYSNDTIPGYGPNELDYIYNYCRSRQLIGDIRQLNKNYEYAIKAYTDGVKMFEVYSPNHPFLSSLYISRALMYKAIGDKNRMNLDLEKALNINDSELIVETIRDFKYFEHIYNKHYKSQFEEYSKSNINLQNNKSG